MNIPFFTIHSILLVLVGDLPGDSPYDLSHDLKAKPSRALFSCSILRQCSLHK